jgi:hypothetical protein
LVWDSIIETWLESRDSQLNAIDASKLINKD